ncbi:fatty acid desaturase family protein [Haliangium sp.]
MGPANPEDSEPADEPGAKPRTGQTLVAATKPFARELRAKSWWCFWSTLAIVCGVLTAAALVPWWPVRAIASIFGGLMMVRLFILYHDYMHGSILRRSRVAKLVLYVCGGLLLAPPSSWRKNHNLHHTNMGKLRDPQVGGFPLLTVTEWRDASKWTRVRYRVSRHPLTILTAAFTVFFLSMTLGPLTENWRKHWDSLLALLGHVAVIALLCWFGGFATALFAFILPYGIAATLGAYLFFVQHNFVGMKLLPAEEWSAEKAAILSSSHLDLGLVMRWFTGDIGYHHVHHLNRTIPFYRLAEAMQALPELQGTAKTTTLIPRDVVACIRLALWDEEKGRMVSYAEAAADA